ncbi:hypothetical protein [Micromonospora ureilytica]|uniref:Uncharacterized protein n=1 Tax=Micromonospora ureilytica TaxID=709868 RepID=A0ABS0JK36_9ACTN|nr:hypothetical protein [Micromonospora ureilytica]MBG6067437.1 hypothetical protein [Micromonospora ureilytica]
MRRAPGQDGVDPSSRPAGADAEYLSCPDGAASIVETGLAHRPQ